LRPLEDAIYCLAPAKHKTQYQLEIGDMAVIRRGNKAVLLVVDVRVGVMRNAWDANRIIKNIGVAVEKARG